MDRNSRRHGHNRGRNWNDSKNNKPEQKPVPAPHHPVVTPEDKQDMVAKEKAIRDYRARQIICPLCGQPITDMSSALADKNTGAPVHFDCVLTEIGKTEHVKENEKITYIGQGRFAVLSFENPRDLRHFKIERVIEWEERNKPLEWRNEIAGLYSQVKQI